MRIARTPEERPPRLAERIEGPDEREITQRLLLQTDAGRELVEPAIGAASIALGDDGLRFLLTEAFHLLEPDAHVVDPAGALRGDRFRAVRDVPLDAGWTLLDDGLRVGCVHVHGKDRDPMTLRISGDDRG